MLRFIDCTDEDTGKQCAFLDTITMSFITLSDRTQVFTCIDDLKEHYLYGNRLIHLLPPDFFDLPIANEF